jgi:hypothetical protein
MLMAVSGSRATLGGVTGLRGIGTRAGVTSSPAGCSLAGAALSRRVRGPSRNLGAAVPSQSQRRVTVRAAAAEESPPKQVCAYPSRPSLPSPARGRLNPRSRCDRGQLGWDCCGLGLAACNRMDFTSHRLWHIDHAGSPGASAKAGQLAPDDVPNPWESRGRVELVCGWGCAWMDVDGL